MATPTEDDLDALPGGELISLPDDAIPQGWLSEFFTRRAAAIYQHDGNERALELSGDSSLHLMIFRDQDPREKRRRKEEEERQRLAEQELQEYRDRSDHLLARIDEQERVEGGSRYHGHVEEKASHQGQPIAVASSRTSGNLRPSRGMFTALLGV